MLSLEDVGYVLPGGRRLFDGIALTLSPGDAIAIAGPSGVGKSTLLGIIGGLLKPTSGSVTMSLSWLAQRTAWVPQGLNSLSGRSAVDNAALYSLIDGEPRSVARRAAMDQLAKLGLEDYIHTRVRRLSGGELQRVAVARAVSCGRPLILADEPTNQLDEESAARVMLTLFDSASDGRAVVVVTHDHYALPGNCTILRLSGGGLHVVSRPV